MLRGIQQRDQDRNRWIKISMGVILVLICVSMVVTLVPGLMSGPSTDASSPDAIASVAGHNISVVEFQQRFDQLMSNQQIPQMMRGIYAKQLLNDLVFQQALDYEAQQMGIEVTPAEEAARIRQMIPDAWVNNKWDPAKYETDVEQGTGGMSVQQFESSLRDEMLTDKFRQLVTDGITVSPAEVAQEFRWRNDRIKLQYVLIKPSTLASTIQPTDAQLQAWFQQNKSRYQIPEKRSATYALLDLAQLRASTKPTDTELQTYYKAHLADYKVENRVNVAHILFKTVGKTDAEIAEIRKKAEDVLKQAKSGANFQDLAKKYTEDDASKANGGNLGWILQGQTVPAFEKAAFSVPVGQVSDLVTTPYGFEIIKVLDRETAHTKSFAEVQPEIQKDVTDQQVSDQANTISGEMADAVRNSDRQSLAALAKKYNLELGQVSPVSINDPIGPLGASKEISQILFSLEPGELSQPVQTNGGFVILTVNNIVPAHQGRLEEVHAQALTDYQQEKSVDLARQRAADLAQKVKAGEQIDKAAKELGLTVATSDPFARNGSIAAVGSGRQLAAAFDLQAGQSGGPQQIEGNWVVYQVMSHEDANPSDFATQQAGIKQELLQTRQNAAFEAFRTSLLDQLRKQGKLTINNNAMTQFTQSS